jgi:hypothetical protein
MKSREVQNSIALILHPTKFVSAAVVKRENSPSQLQHQLTKPPPHALWLLGLCNYNVSKVAALCPEFSLMCYRCDRRSGLLSIPFSSTLPA